MKHRPPSARPTGRGKGTNCASAGTCTHAQDAIEEVSEALHPTFFSNPADFGSVPFRIFFLCSSTTAAAKRNPIPPKTARPIKAIMRIGILPPPSLVILPSPAIYTVIAVTNTRDKVVCNSPAFLSLNARLLNYSAGCGLHKKK